MGGLYALSYMAGVTYQTMNNYCYFVFYPATFALFLKSKSKYWVLLFKSGLIYLYSFIK